MKKIIVALLAAVSVLQVWGGDLETAKKQGLKFSDDGTTLLYCPKDIKEVVIPRGVTIIDSKAFSDCRNLTSITISDSVKKIGKFAFLGCTNLKSITIPDSVEKIGSGAFAGCTSLKIITIPKNLDIKYVGLPKTCKVIRR